MNHYYPNYHHYIFTFTIHHYLIYLKILQIIINHLFYLNYNFIIKNIYNNLFYTTDLIYQNYNIYIDYVDNNHDDQFENIDDNYILLNTLKLKNIDFKSIDFIIYFTDNKYWTKYNNIKTFAFIIK